MAWPVLGLDPDPWKWSTAEVERFFRIAAAEFVRELPGAASLGGEPFLAALSENEVAGSDLLTSVDLTGLRDTLGIKGMKTQTAVLRCIQKLRLLSTTYKNEDAVQPTTSVASPGLTVRTGETVIDDGSGRKRRKLNLTTHNQDESVIDPRGTEFGSLETTALNDTDSRERPNDTYRALVSKKLRQRQHETVTESAFSLDEMFFGSTGFSEEITKPRFDRAFVYKVDTPSADYTGASWHFCHSHKSHLERIFVYRRMQHFLNAAEEVDLRRKGEDVVAVVPYAKSLKDEPSAIVFQHSETKNKIVALREVAAHLESNVDKLGVQDGSDDWDYLLTKHTEKELLPVYGESESGESESGDPRENTVVDEAGANALQISDEEPEAEEVASEGEEDLDTETANKVIDGWTEEFIRAWNDRLPQREEKSAWKVWKKMKQSRLLRSMLIQKAEAKIKHFNDRMTQIRLQLLKSQWTTTRALREACAALEPTLEDLEEQKWMINVWQRRQEPVRVVHHRARERGPNYPSTNSASKAADPFVMLGSDDRLSVEPGEIQHVNHGDLRRDALVNASHEGQHLGGDIPDAPKMFDSFVSDAPDFLASDPPDVLAPDALGPLAPDLLAPETRSTDALATGDHNSLAPNALIPNASDAPDLRLPERLDAPSALNAPDAIHASEGLDASTSFIPDALVPDKRASGALGAPGALREHHTYEADDEDAKLRIRQDASRLPNESEIDKLPEPAPGRALQQYLSSQQRIKSPGGDRSTETRTTLRTPRRTATNRQIGNTLSDPIDIESSDADPSYKAPTRERQSPLQLRPRSQRTRPQRTRLRPQSSSKTPTKAQKKKLRFHDRPYQSSIDDVESWSYEALAQRQDRKRLLIKRFLDYSPEILAVIGADCAGE